MTGTPTTDVIERVERFAGYLENGYSVFAGGARNEHLDPDDLRELIRLARAGVSRQGDEEKVARAVFAEMRAACVERGGDTPPEFDTLAIDELSFVSRIACAALKAIGGGSGYEG